MIYVLIRSGRLQSVKIGKLRRITSSQLNAYLADASI
jgi:excisionase family DNA binding protein